MTTVFSQPIDHNSFNMALMLNNLKEKLLDRFRTGHPLWDTAVVFLVISSQESISNFISYIKSLLVKTPQGIMSIIRFLINLKKKPATKKMTKTVTVKYITDSREINTLYEPVMWYLNSQTNTVAEPQTELMTIKTNQEITENIPKNRSATIKHLTYDIHYKIHTEMITIHGDKEYKRENTIITLSLNIDPSGEDVLKQFGSFCVAKYNEWNSKKTWQQLVFRNEKDIWKSQPSVTNRKLKTIVLKERQLEDITDDIDDFVEKEEWYVSRDVPYTRNYLFWGYPGTGKSSLIKAIASYTKRHIHYLVLSEIKSDGDLFKLFEKINFAQTILVIEDIDCASSITHTREEVKKEEKKEGDEKKDEEKKEVSTLTLSGLLNALDGGIISNHRQILIMTTNHPEKLDPALTRPGRIDRKLEFSKCDTQQIEKLFYNFFNMAPPVRHEFASGTISPAEVTSVLLQYKKNPVDAWNKLIQKFC